MTVKSLPSTLVQLRHSRQAYPIDAPVWWVDCHWSPGFFGRKHLQFLRRLQVEIACPLEELEAQVAMLTAAPAAPALGRRIVPWVEKYRPRRIVDIKHQPEVVRVLKAAVASGNLSHLLFYGTPGTGKTSAALALARELFCGDIPKDRVLELNSSDERGINVVRTKIKTFAQATAQSTFRGKAVPPFKLIILDEADSMTTDAQAALRRTMEAFARSTRFILICNYVSRIIEPIASRCAKFRFQPLPVGIVVQRLEAISKVEGMSLQPELLMGLYNASGGDLRKAITGLQSVRHLYGDSATIENVAECVGALPPRLFDLLFESLYSGKFDAVKAAVTEIMHEGYGALQVLGLLLSRILQLDDVDDDCKAQLVRTLGDADFYVADGGDEHLQLFSACAQIMRAISKKA